MNIVVFTGAGISRESGLKTFRDSEDGLWEGHDVMQVASIQGWWNDPQTVLDFYNVRRKEVIKAVPNAAHLALVELEEHHKVTIITQNVDDLHERAGSSTVIHLHGEVLKARPADDGQSIDSDYSDSQWPVFKADRILEWRQDLNLGDVDQYGAQLRPHIVWFGEGLPDLDKAVQAGLAVDVDILIIVGTTLNVYPAASIATESHAKQIYLVDPNPPKLNLRNLEVVAKPASEGVLEVVRKILQKTVQ